MSFEKISRRLLGDTPGRSTELNYFRVGPEQAEKKVYLQAALHCDEQPGILILHHLLKLLREADERGELAARFVLFPMVNPLGMGDIEFDKLQGRYSRASGVNHNRDWPSLYEAVAEDVKPRLGDDADENVRLVRQAVRDWVEQMPRSSALDQWRYHVIGEACDADYVFDLHCDDDSLLHIFSVPQLADNMQQLADWTGAAATLMAEDSGGNAFDEVWPTVWLRLAADCPDKPIPLSVVSCTLEYRGQIDTFDSLNLPDAQKLYGYFQEQGLIGGPPVGGKGKAPAASDLRATEFMTSPGTGLLAFRVELGERVEKGEPVADLLRLDGDGAFTERVPVPAGTSGVVISRQIFKFVWPNHNICKIVGEEILDRGDYLLSD